MTSIGDETSTPAEISRGGDSSEVVLTRRNLGPHEPDLLDLPLDEAYRGKSILDGASIHWGLLYEVNPDGWIPAEVVESNLADARVRWMPPGVSFDPNGGVEDMLDIAVALISVDTGVAGSIDGARERGRSAARQAAALVMSRTRLLSGRNPIWEGPFASTGSEKLGFVSASRVIQVTGQSPESIRKSLAPLAGARVLDGVDERVSFARHWYLRAWETQDLLDRFVNFWLTAAALYESHRPAGGDRERNGIAAYVVDLARRRGLSATVRDEITLALLEAYELRNRVFHQGRFDDIGRDAVVRLESAVTRCISEEI
jgi:hypothetical protein